MLLHCLVDFYGEFLVFTSVVINGHQGFALADALRVLLVFLRAVHVLGQFYIFLKHLGIVKNSLLSLLNELIKDFRHLCIVARINSNLLNNFPTDVILYGFCSAFLMASVALTS